MVDSTEIKSVKSMCVGNYFGYIINENFLVYQIDLNNFTNKNLDNILNVSIFEFFKKKEIHFIFCGYNTFFALEKQEIDCIKNWDNNKVLQWAIESGFSEYKNILKYENISGNDIFNADKKFLKDTLGLIK